VAGQVHARSAWQLYQTARQLGHPAFRVERFAAAPALPHDLAAAPALAADLLRHNAFAGRLTVVGPDVELVRRSLIGTAPADERSLTCAE
jgi:hypothetical protein